MSKKTLIAIIASVSVVILALTGWGIYKVSKNSKEAQLAADQFVVLMLEGDLEMLQLSCYAYDETENVLLTNEAGQAQVRVITEQQFAEKYGADLLKRAMGENETEEAEETSLYQVIMAHSRAAAKTKLAFTSKTSMTLQIVGPDMKTWLESLSSEEITELSSAVDGKMEDLEARMENGEIPQRLHTFIIPMIKQNGTWRFEVSQEVEDAFYGGIYDILNQQENEVEE